MICKAPTQASQLIDIDSLQHHINLQKFGDSLKIGPGSVACDSAEYGAEMLNACLSACLKCEASIAVNEVV